MQVEFHTGLDDPLDFACRLLRKAYRTGARVAVTAPPARLAQLDRQLWVFDERDFVPHVRLAAPGADRIAPRTPIWLLDEGWCEGAPPILVNLGADAPPPGQGVSRLIELVGREPGEQARGRERWRTYKALGLEPVHHGGAAR